MGWLISPPGHRHRSRIRRPQLPQLLPQRPIVGILRHRRRLRRWPIERTLKAEKPLRRISRVRQLVVLSRIPLQPPHLLTKLVERLPRQLVSRRRDSSVVRLVRLRVQLPVPREARMLPAPHRAVASRPLRVLESRLPPSQRHRPSHRLGNHRRSPVSHGLKNRRRQGRSLRSPGRNRVIKLRVPSVRPRSRVKALRSQVQSPVASELLV